MNEFKHITNVLYFTEANLTLKRAHVYNILKTSEAINKDGKVSIFISAVSKTNVSENELINKILSKLEIDRNFLHFSFRKEGFLDGIKFLIKNKNNFDVFYYRSVKLIHFALFAKLVMGKKIILELHRTHRKWWKKPVWWLNLYFSDGVIFITHALNEYYKKYNYKSAVVFCNTFEDKFFNSYKNISKKEAREILGLPVENKIVVYTGRSLVYDFKNIFEALNKFKDIFMVMVGVTNKKELVKLGEKFGVLEKIKFIERIELKKVPLYQLAGDVLVVPSLGYDPGDIPIKIFEYMGSGRPIVSYKNEAISEVLSNGINAVLLEEDDTEQWVRALTLVFSNQEFSKNISERALADSHKYTWDKRGLEISRFIKKK